MLIAGAHVYFSSKGTPYLCVEATTVISGFSMALGLSESTTQLLKLMIQRRRPNFYELCGFDKQVLLKCTADLKQLREANFSFPSGHSSLACCGMTFLVWYFLGKNSNQRGRPQRRRQFVGRFLSAVIPWGWAILVAASRLIDKWHHPSDVLAGLALGFGTCTIAYHTWYPPVWSQYAGIPRGSMEEGQRSFDTYDLDSGSGSNKKLPSFSD
jgi:diacylglycerol diphosphate phosphatase/phosphatidate phosphatase